MLSFLEFQEKYNLDAKYNFAKGRMLSSLEFEKKYNLNAKYNFAKERMLSSLEFEEKYNLSAKLRPKSIEFCREYIECAATLYGFDLSYIANLNRIHVEFSETPYFEKLAYEFYQFILKTGNNILEAIYGDYYEEFEKKLETNMQEAMYEIMNSPLFQPFDVLLQKIPFLGDLARIELSGINYDPPCEWEENMTKNTVYYHKQIFRFVYELMYMEKHREIQKEVNFQISLIPHGTVYEQAKNDFKIRQKLQMIEN